LEGDAVDHFERRVSLRWVTLFVLVMVGLLGVGWAYTSAILAQERERQQAEEARAQAEAAKQFADPARREAAEKAAPLPQRHFLEKGRSYYFSWQNFIGPAVVLEEPRDGWVRVKVRGDDSDQWINLSTVHRIMVAPQAKGGKDTDERVVGATGNIKGVVTFLGKPVANGRVSFHPEKGKAVEADTSEDGTYSAKDVPVGSLRVTVTAKGLPEKYADKEQTPFLFQVQKGENQLDIALKR
jgi:hypothetical protein